MKIHFFLSITHFFQQSTPILHRIVRCLAHNILMNQKMTFKNTSHSSGFFDEFNRRTEKKLNHRRLLEIEFDQGMYKNRVNNDKIFFEISALLSCEYGNSDQGKFKITYIFWIFPLHFLLDFLVHKIKEREFEIFLCHSLPNFYTYILHSFLQTVQYFQLKIY